MNYTTKEILQKIEAEFAQAYRNAAPFVKSGGLWDFCITVLSNSLLVNNIIFANDLGIPPVRSLLHIYEKQRNPAEGFMFRGQESQWLGSLMGFLFLDVFMYNKKKERVQVKRYGVGTASRFSEGPDNLIVGC